MLLCLFRIVVAFVAVAFVAVVFVVVVYVVVVYVELTNIVAAVDVNIITIVYYTVTFIDINIVNLIITIIKNSVPQFLLPSGRSCSFFGHQGNHRTRNAVLWVIFHLQASLQPPLLTSHLTFGLFGLGRFEVGLLENVRWKQIVSGLRHALQRLVWFLQHLFIQKKTFFLGKKRFYLTKKTFIQKKFFYKEKQFFNRKMQLK